MTNYLIPKGFRFLGKHVGIKKKKPDFGLIFAEHPCISAAMFTKNTYCGVSIPIWRGQLFC
ncbi:MAG: hypothetical protein LBS33_03000 [Streptococcaceae bacterium]|jgi:glutamate N-acetyltransferase/amino-acid N-acetyltransferase|nr:hypothetical protein [Streptococcaceae bacterium]